MCKKTRLWATMLIVLMLVAAVAGCAGRRQGSLKSGNTGQQKGLNHGANQKEVILATTTSTVDSGLLDVLKPMFEKETGYLLTIVSVGSGQAIELAKRGEADALLVHSPKDEKAIEEGKVVVNRQPVMHNDFLLVGPAGDPAKIRGKSIVDAFKAIAAGKVLFVSRGDNSGTHKKELSIWQKAGIEPSGSWYQETGAGMGQTLNVAAEKGGYTLTDRATYLAQKNNSGLQIMVEGDHDLLNIYHVMQVNPARFSKVNAAGGKALVDFMVSPATQDTVKNFGIDKYGQSLFIPEVKYQTAKVN